MSGTETGQGALNYIDADLRDPQKILAQAAQTLDFSRPVAVMLIAIMHLIGDQDDPGGIIRQLMAAVPAGSYLALSQVASDIEAEQMAEAAKRYNRLARETRAIAPTPRSFASSTVWNYSNRAWSRSSDGGRHRRSRPRPIRPCGAA